MTTTAIDLVWLKCGSKSLPTRKAEQAVKALSAKFPEQRFETRFDKSTSAGPRFWVAVIAPRSHEIERFGKTYRIDRWNGSAAPLIYDPLVVLS